MGRKVFGLTVTDNTFVDESVVLPPEFMTAIAVIFVCELLLWLLSSWALSNVFAKAGESRWKAWVPIVNGIVMLRMGHKSLKWLLLLIPIFILPFLAPSQGDSIATLGIITLVLAIEVVLLVISIQAIHNINKQFGRGAGSTVLCLFLPVIWSLIVGLGPDRWNPARV